MRSRNWTVLALVFILLSAAAGMALLALGGAPEGPLPPTVLPTPTLPPTSSPPPPLLLSPTPAPLLYTVQEGDTLAGIAAAHGVSLEALVAANGLSDPDLIHVGQVLVIPEQAAPSPPEESPATPPPPTPPPFPTLPSPTPAGPPLVEIAGVLGAGDPAAEAVRVRNRGGAVSLDGWTLSDTTGNSFTFPRLVLFPGGEVVVHSEPGVSTPTHLYWGRTDPAWDPGELIALRDREGEVVDTYIVP